MAPSFWRCRFGAAVLALDFLAPGRFGAILTMEHFGAILTMERFGAILKTGSFGAIVSVRRYGATLSIGRFGANLSLGCLIGAMKVLQSGGAKNKLIEKNYIIFSMEFN